MSIFRYKSDNQIEEDNLSLEIEKILQASVRNNQKDELTGLFFLIENRFLQLIEGEEENVMKCFERIKSDVRHSNVSILIYRNVENRLFEDWTMHFMRIEGAEAFEKLGISKLKDIGVSKWEDHFKDNLAILFLECFARLSLRQDANC